MSKRVSVFLMIAVALIAICLSYIHYSVQMMCISYIIILLLGFAAVVTDKRTAVFGPFMIYLLGYNLFLGGRFIAGGLSGDCSQSLFSFDFGYQYTLDPGGSIQLYSLITFSLIASFCGYFSLRRPKRRIDYAGDRSAPPIRSRRWKLLSLAALFFLLIQTGYVLTLIVRVARGGYIAIYRESDPTWWRINLVAQIISDVLVSIIYARKSLTGESDRLYMVVISLFFLNGIASVLSGIRGRFISILLVFLYVILNKKRLSLKRSLLLGILCALTIIATNYITSSTRFTGPKESVWESIVSTLEGQGISMMVFDLGTKVPIGEYPLAAIMKTILPGSQLLIRQIDPTIKPYEMSNDTYLTHRYSPSSYEEGYGYGWSVLSDFYILSYGNVLFFLLFSFVFGRLVSLVEERSKASEHYAALSFLLSIYLFTLPRNSISVVIASVIIFFITTLILIPKRFSRKLRA